MEKRDNNTRAFLELVKAGLWEKDAHLLPFGKIEFSAVYKLAEEQSVTGLVAAGLEHVVDVNIPKEVSLSFAGSVLQLEQRNIAMNQFIGKLIERMRGADIYTLLIKGQGVAQCYDRPLWRACGDVDLLLSENNYSKAKEYLMPFSTATENEYQKEKHLAMTIDGWLVELHGKLYCGLSSRMERTLGYVYQDSFLNGNVRSWDNNGIQIFQLKTENDVFYVFTHILQHFYKEGVGIRQICDWCRLLWTYRNKLNLDYLRELIYKAGITSVWKGFGAFAVDYLGMPPEAMPLYDKDLKWSRKGERIKDYVLEVGNMGHNRDNTYYSNHSYIIRKAISLSRRVKDLGRHVSIFPLSSLRYFPHLVFQGISSAVKGE